MPVGIDPRRPELDDVGRRPGSSSAAARPFGSAQHRHRRPARPHGAHRRAGQQHVTQVVQASDEHAARSSPRADQQVDGLGQVAGDDRGRVDLRPARRLGSGTRIAVAPALVAESTSAPMSPITAHRSAATLERGGGLLDQAGLRLAAAAAVPGAVVADQPRTEWPEQLLRCGRSRARTCCSVISPRATPLWLLTTAVRIRATRRRSSASRAPGIGTTRSGSPLYGTSSIERAVTVEQHGGRSLSGDQAAGAQPAACPRCHVATGGMATTGDDHRGDLAGGARPRPDPAGSEGAGTGQPGRAGDADHEPAAGVGQRAARRRRPGRLPSSARAGGPARGRSRPGAPVPAVEASHQHVVGVPRLGADARPPAAPAARDAPPRARRHAGDTRPARTRTARSASSR